VLSDQPDLAKGALLELATNAVTPEHFARVDDAASSDFGLAWRVAATRAAQGDYDEAAVESLLERDPDPDAPYSALAVRTARPLTEAKEEAWHALYVERSVPSGLATSPITQAFWQPEQRDLLMPFTWRYLEEVPKLAGGLMLKVGGLINGMFPDVGDRAFIDEALALAHARGTDPTVRSGLLNGCDALVRKLRARGEL
jgi:aminopeptidase N